MFVPLLVLLMSSSFTISSSPCFSYSSVVLACSLITSVLDSFATSTFFSFILIASLFGLSVDDRRCTTLTASYVPPETLGLIVSGKRMQTMNSGESFL